jgi:hypothetical protein
LWVRHTFIFVRCLYEQDSWRGSRYHEPARLWNHLGVSQGVFIGHSR